MLHDNFDLAVDRAIRGAGDPSHQAQGQGGEGGVGQSFRSIEPIERLRPPRGTVRLDEGREIVPPRFVALAAKRLEQSVGAERVEERHHRAQRGEVFGLLRRGPQGIHIEVVGRVPEALDVARLDPLLGGHLLRHDQNGLRAADVAVVELSDGGMDHLAEPLRDFLAVLAEGDDLTHGPQAFTRALDLACFGDREGPPTGQAFGD